MLGLSCVVGGRANAIFPPDRIDRAAVVGLFEDRHDFDLINFDWRMRTS